MVAGTTLRGAWLPRAALLSGAGLLLGLAVLNPDAWVAQQNIDRYAETGKVDWLYLQDLSDDAVPVLATLADDVVECALDGRSISDDDWLEGSISRARAHSELTGHTAAQSNGEAWGRGGRGKSV